MVVVPSSSTVPASPLASFASSGVVGQVSGALLRWVQKSHSSPGDPSDACAKAPRFLPQSKEETEGAEGDLRRKYLEKKLCQHLDERLRLTSLALECSTEEGSMRSKLADGSGLPEDLEPSTIAMIASSLRQQREAVGRIGPGRLLRRVQFCIEAQIHRSPAFPRSLGEFFGF